MIVKPSTKADECAAISAFIDAAGFDQLPERARKNALVRRRGLEGERSTAHILDRHFHDAPNHALLHDLRLPDGIGGFAQFDHVILSRLSRTAAVVEVKNYRGRLSKNEHDEWLVWYEGRRRPIDIPNPLAQARRQKEVLRAWLKARSHDIAFETIGAFVIIPPDCSIDRSKIGADVAIYKADNFIAAWTTFGGITPLGRIFSTGVSAKTLLSIGAQLAGDHQPDPRGIEEMIGLRSSRPAGETVSTMVVSDTAPEAIIETVDDGVGDDDVREGVQDASAAVSETAPVAPKGSLVPNPSPIPASGKASARIEVIPGIYERTLPDGRVAFLADQDDASRDRLRRACDGVARWNPVFRNWLSDAASALAIRNALQSTPLPTANGGTGDVASIPNCQGRAGSGSHVAG